MGCVCDFLQRDLRSACGEKFAKDAATYLHLLSTNGSGKVRAPVNGRRTRALQQHRAVTTESSPFAEEEQRVRALIYFFSMDKEQRMASQTGSGADLQELKSQLESIQQELAIDKTTPEAQQNSSNTPQS